MMRLTISIEGATEEVGRLSRELLNHPDGYQLRLKLGNADELVARVGAESSLSETREPNRMQFVFSADAPSSLRT